VPDCLNIILCVCLWGGGEEKLELEDYFAYSTQLSIPVFDVHADHVRRAKYLAVNAMESLSKLFLTCLHAICSYNSNVYKNLAFRCVPTF